MDVQIVSDERKIIVLPFVPILGRFGERPVISGTIGIDLLFDGDVLPYVVSHLVKKEKREQSGCSAVTVQEWVYRKEIQDQTGYQQQVVRSVLIRIDVGQYHLFHRLRGLR